jgi:NAD-dependent SIR2 family protein deacetylase
VNVEALVQLIAGRRVVALTGAGCSTESGIPDYRGPGARPRRPIQHREFVEQPEMRRRYWARSLLGWPRIEAARPNPTHTALAALEHAGVVVGTITQNVDGLHQRGGSRSLIELHGALARVRCLECGAIISRADLQHRMTEANPSWPPGEEQNEAAPDGDAELAADLDAFSVVPCAACDGVLMPDVVFFGGSVPRDTLDAAWATLDRAEVLLVAGSSLTVFSGYRFVRRAAERNVPIAIVNRGPTRGDPHAALRVDALTSETMVALQRAMT